MKGHTVILNQTCTETDRILYMLVMWVLINIHASDRSGYFFSLSYSYLQKNTAVIYSTCEKPELCLRGFKIG